MRSKEWSDSTSDATVGAVKAVPCSPFPVGTHPVPVTPLRENSGYVVKLKGTVQGIRTLLNEYVAGRLGELFGVPFGDHALVQLPASLFPPEGEQNIRQGLPGNAAEVHVHERGHPREKV